MSLLSLTFLNLRPFFSFLYPLGPLPPVRLRETLNQHPSQPRWRAVPVHLLSDKRGFGPPRRLILAPSPQVSSYRSRRLVLPATPWIRPATLAHACARKQTAGGVRKANRTICLRPPIHGDVARVCCWHRALGVRQLSIGWLIHSKGRTASNCVN